MLSRHPYVYSILHLAMITSVWGRREKETWWHHQSRCWPSALTKCCYKANNKNGEQNKQEHRAALILFGFFAPIMNTAQLNCCRRCIENSYFTPHSTFTPIIGCFFVPGACKCETNTVIRPSVSHTSFPCKFMMPVKFCHHSLKTNLYGIEANDAFVVAVKLWTEFELKEKR